MEMFKIKDLSSGVMDKIVELVELKIKLKSLREFGTQACENEEKENIILTTKNNIANGIKLDLVDIACIINVLRTQINAIEEMEINF